MIAALSIRTLADEPALAERFIALPALARAAGGNARATGGPAAGSPTGTAYDRAVLAAALAEPNDARAFLALDGDTAVARVLAFADDRLREPDGRPIGRLGLFAAADDPGAVRDLLGAALDWLASRPPGRRPARVVAPMDGDTWHRYRLRTSGFEHPALPGEPGDAPYYPALLEGAGFAPIARFVTKTVAGDGVDAVMARWAPAHARACRRGFAFRSLAPPEAVAEVDVVHPLAQRVFGDNPFFRPIGRAEFAARVAGEAGVTVVAGGAWRLLLAFDPAGAPAGLCFGLADPSAASTACLKSFGIVPEWRGTALGPALAYAAYADWARRGATRFHHALMRADAGAADLDRGAGEITRTYALYGRAVGEGEPR